MTIIFLVPIRDDSDIFDVWANHIYELNPKPDNIIFCENNSKDNTLTQITNFKLPHELIRFWTTQVKGYDVLAHARDLLLTRARQINPDYAIFLSTDVLIKSCNVITVLTERKKDIVGSESPRVNLCLPVLFKNPTNTDSEVQITTLYLGNVGVRTYPRTSFEEVYTVGFECVCLSRTVIQDKRLNFYPLLPPCSEDFSYLIKAQKLGYKVYLDSTLQLEHLLRAEKKRGWDYITNP